jgi:hypothetical protein
MRQPQFTRIGRGSKMRLLLLAFFAGSLTPLYAIDPIYSLDFTTQPSGNALPWLKEQGFQFKLGIEAMNPRFEKGALVLSTERPEAGVLGYIFAGGSELSGVERLRLVWGVSKFPDGANWERGINRTALAVMVSFGHERLSSGLPFGLFAAPYFISPFIGAKEIEGKTYTGKFWKKGGRYLCVKCPNVGEIVVTDLNVDQLFKKLFNKTPTPPVTAIGIQMNTKGTEGKAAAFIRRIEFLPGS